jgi:SAM-dependent methyltransferase
MSDIHERVRAYYRAAATGSPDVDAVPVNDDRWGTARYDADAVGSVPEAASGLSMGCGNPHALADLRRGEVVLDLGSGAGMDVILSARRVGPTGRTYGVDFLDEMLELATANAAEAGIDNVDFLAATMESVPLPDGAVDVVISNCVINLAPDKAPVFAEMARVVRPGGRIAISDVVVDEMTDPADLTDEEWAECGAGGLDRETYEALLTAAGFTEVSIVFTHDVGPGLHGAAVTARQPVQRPVDEA